MVTRGYCGRFHEQGLTWKASFIGYVFCARDAIPSYEKVAACITHAIQAGILRVPHENHFSLTPEWFSHLHRLDEKYTCPESGISVFEDSFVWEKWPVVEQTEFLLNKDEYDNAAKNVAQYYDNLIKKVKRRHRAWFAPQHWWSWRDVFSWLNVLFKDRKT